MEFLLDEVRKYSLGPGPYGLAVEFLESGYTECGLSLLKKNWKKSDDPLIRNVVMKSQRVSHPMQMDLRDIYLEHKSADCGDVLIHAYRNGDCSFCRSEIVKAMGKNGVLTNKILIECKDDSYDMTRKFANGLIRRRGMNDTALRPSIFHGL